MLGLALALALGNQQVGDTAIRAGLLVICFASEDRPAKAEASEKVESEKPLSRSQRRDPHHSRDQEQQDPTAKGKTQQDGNGPDSSGVGPPPPIKQEKAASIERGAVGSVLRTAGAGRDINSGVASTGRDTLSTWFGSGQDRRPIRSPGGRVTLSTTVVPVKKAPIKPSGSVNPRRSPF